MDESSSTVMGKGKRKMKGKRKGARNAAAVQVAQPAQGSTAVTAAADYLSLWFVEQQAAAPPTPASGESGRWKFNKTRQSFLLKGWPHRHRVSSASFKQLLVYMRSLPAGTQERTATQAREVASTAEVAEKAPEVRAAELRAGAAEEEKDADDGTGEDQPTGGVSAAEVEERRAVLQIQRARALKVLKALTGE